MSTNKKIFLIILFILSYSIHLIAQTGYYYNGKKIPLTIHKDKVCVSIPHEYKNVNKRIAANAKVLQRINDATFDIYVITQSSLKKLSSSKSWKEDSKSIIQTLCYRTENNHEVFTSPYLNVRLKKAQDIDLLTSYAEKYGFEIVKQVPLMPLWYILSVTTQSCEKDVLECANELWESGLFAASVPDFCSKEDMCCSNDILFDYQWGLYNTTHSGIDISICSAWNYATGKNVKIAIIDQGVDLNHIDLISNISSLSYDTETNTSPSVCYGEHGTHCAGIAAATKDNNIFIAGVAPDASIVSISNRLNSTTNSRINRACGITWAYQHGVDIISNSWSSSTSHPAIDEAIYNAFRYGRNGKGCVVVFSTGNQGAHNINYPACCNDTILAVGSIYNAGMRSTFSNYGTGLDIVAPGEDILSTIPNNHVDYMSGTSMACPHVSGVAALVLERNPELTVTQVNSIICQNTKKLSEVNFNKTKTEGSWNEEYGYGLVDAYSSVINTPEIVYIQNDTITGIRTINADKIYVGKDVTDRTEKGKVTLGPGNITLKANSVIIKNSTKVPLNTKLKIEKY